MDVEFLNNLLRGSIGCGQLKQVQRKGLELGFVLLLLGELGRALGLILRHGVKLPALLPQFAEANAVVQGQNEKDRQTDPERISSGCCNGCLLCFLTHGTCFTCPSTLRLTFSFCRLSSSIKAGSLCAAWATRTARFCMVVWVCCARLI